MTTGCDMSVKMAVYKKSIYEIYFAYVSYIARCGI